MAGRQTQPGCGHHLLPRARSWPLFLTVTSPSGVVIGHLWPSRQALALQAEQADGRTSTGSNANKQPRPRTGLWREAITAVSRSGTRWHRSVAAPFGSAADATLWRELFLPLRDYSDPYALAGDPGPPGPPA